MLSSHVHMAQRPAMTATKTVHLGRPPACLLCFIVMGYTQDKVRATTTTTTTADATDYMYASADRTIASRRNLVPSEMGDLRYVYRTILSSARSERCIAGNRKRLDQGAGALDCLTGSGSRQDTWYWCYWSCDVQQSPSATGLRDHQRQRVPTTATSHGLSPCTQYLLVS